MERVAEEQVSSVKVLLFWLVRTLNVFRGLTVSGWVILTMIIATCFYSFKDLIIPLVLTLRQNPLPTPKKHQIQKHS